MPTYSRDSLPYNLLKKQYLRPGENAYTYFDNLAAWIRAGSATSKNYSVSTTNGGVVQNEFAPTRFQFPAFYVNEGSAGGGPEFRITHTSNFSDTFGPKDNFIISFWLKLVSYSHSDATSAGSNIICITDGSSGKRILEVFCTESGASAPQIGIRIYDKDDQTAGSVKFAEALSNNVIASNVWTHITIAVEGGASLAGDDWVEANLNPTAVRIYLDGVSRQSASISYSNAAVSNTPNFSVDIGHSSSSVIVKFGNGGGSSVPASDTVDDSYMNGFISDVAIYNNPSLSTINTLAPLLYKLSTQGAFQEQSGFLNNPEKIMRNTLDERSYWPSTVKGGDQRRIGNAAIKWDDYKLPEFTTNQVSYPSMLHRNDSLLTSSIYQTYVDGQLNVVTGSRTIPRYAYDMFYEREDEVSLSPFEDSRVYIDRSSDFYLSGSDIPGFTGSLAGKDVVVMEFELSEKASFAEPLNTSDYGQSQHFMGYYNFTEDKITMQPGTTVPAEANPSHSDYAAFVAHKQNNVVATVGELYRQLHQETCYGFAPVPHMLVTTGSNGYSAFFPEYYQSAGSPIDLAAFPSDSRYEPTSGSQSIIKASEYIHSPFLVEKIVYQLPRVEAHTGDNTSHRSWITNTSGQPSDFSSYNEQTNQLHVFMMRQYNNPNNVSLNAADYATGSQKFVNDVSSLPRGRYPAKFASSATDLSSSITCTGTTDRDLLFYSPILFHWDVNTAQLNFLISGNPGLEDYFLELYSGIFEASSSIHQNYDKVIQIADKGDGGSSVRIEEEGRPDGDRWLEMSGSVFIEATPKNITKSDFLFPYYNREFVSSSLNYTISRTGISTVPFTWRGGARSYKNEFFASSIGNHVSTDRGSFDFEFLNLYASREENEVLNLQIEKPVREDSPFLLFPEDELILGFQGGISGLIGNDADDSTPSLRDTNVIIESGSIKIQLFGSYIQDNKPKLPSLNQSHGYTEAVHGAIGEISVHDQWDVSYRQEFSGSNPDTFMGIATYFPGASLPDGSDIFEGVPERDGITAYHNMTGSEHFGINAMNRARGGLASDGTVGNYDSLKRNYRLEESELYDKDSVTLNVKEIWAIDNATYYTPGTFENVGIGDGSSDYNSVWPFAFPFEDKYESVNRSFKKLESSDVGSESRLIKFDQETANKFVLFTGAGTFTAPGHIHSNSAQSLFPHLENLDTYYQRLNHMIIFGIGDGHRGIHNIVYTPSRRINYSRGAKYGLSNFYPISRSAVFRRTSYGQFRDMLEPRLYGPTLDSNLTQIDDPIVSRVLISNGAVEFLDAADSIIGNKDENYRVKTPFFDIPEVEVTISPVNINNIVTTVIDSL